MKTPPNPIFENAPPCHLPPNIIIKNKKEYFGRIMLKNRRNYDSIKTC
jgi:hypothetical protein